MQRDLFHRAEQVQKNQLKPGDLLFFDTFARLSHVGIYIGDGQFIHAPRRGLSVSIESMDSSYYRKRYVGARRVMGESAAAANEPTSPWSLFPSKRSVMRLFYLRAARRCAALATVAVSLMCGPALVWAQSSTALSLLAGQAPASGLPAHLKTPAWSGYAQAVQQNWQQYQTQIGAPMARWASRELPAFDGTVFYPFSGPDFATVSQLFPNAKRYVLVAM